MDKMCIAPDSSFFICFKCDLKRNDLLYEIVDNYSIYVGNRILKEISTKKTDEKLISIVNVVEVDYYELIKPYFGRNPSHLDDGEYEAIGIAHFLNDLNCLEFLIIDEAIARNFVIKHFPDLKNKLVGTVGFIRDSYCKTAVIELSVALEILNLMYKAVNNIKTKRPCSMDTKNYKNILIPTIKKLKMGRKNA